MLLEVLEHIKKAIPLTKHVTKGMVVQNQEAPQRGRWSFLANASPRSATQIESTMYFSRSM
jgi:hypothetical protein